MQLVRCEQCGAKALIAASQCPRCANAFFLRDSRGETVPLGHCGDCDTYYPRSRGGCKWCGTKASSFPVSPVKLLAGIVAAVSIVAIGVWQYRARSSAPVEPGIEVASNAQIAPVEIPLVTPAAIAMDSGAIADSLMLAGQRLIPEPVTTTIDSSAGTIASTANAATPTARTVIPPAAAAVVPRVPPVPRPTSTYTGPWVRAVAQSWVNVRSSASVSSAVVGVVTPNARVQLGESRGGWRRVRSAGFEGWADASLFDADSSAR